MRNHNSQYIDYYVEMLVTAYQDLASAIIPQNEITQDTATLRSRAANEGMDFLTRILPALGKSIDVSLASGCTLNTLFSGFRKKAGTDLPRFCYDALKVLFRDDGVPWFATWHSDYLQWRKSPEDVEAFNNAFSEYGIDDDSPLMWRLHRRFQVWLATDSSNGMRLFTNRYPGTNILREIGFSRETVDHISLGQLRSPEPPSSDVGLNLRREAMVVALRLLRQVCYMLYKLNIPYTDEQEARTLADFVQVDMSLDFQPDKLDPFCEAVHKQARRIVRRVLCNADPRSGIPKHGPGAVATGEKLPQKHIFKRYYERLAAVFRYDEWFFCNPSHVCDSFQELQAYETLEAGTAKVVLVPKDSRGPRLISCEPLEYQWVQQALMRVLVDTIEQHPLTSGFVNFTDQGVNRRLALEASSNYAWVTLDMKEASDRVSCELVKSLFPDLWWDYLYASRSSHTQLPSGQTVALKKFAPMGSATCFPTEALIFWALSVSAIMIRHNLPLRKAATKVYVYGDDIVVDANYHGVVNSTLPEFGLKLNEDKCCTAGPFKESCGMDALYGQPVTPVKLRELWCLPLKSSSLASYVEYSNEFYRRGMFESAEYLRFQIEANLSFDGMEPTPTVSSEGPGVIAYVKLHEKPMSACKEAGCKIRYRRVFDPAKPDYQRLEVRGYRLETRTTMTSSYGWPFLLRKLAELEAKNSRVSEETGGALSMLTGQYPIAHRTRLKRAWTPLV